ncbi:unnamed protein product [Allacma fusca]|uniref:Diacylglycerol O-acyltransferase n=1 Tax=Allacma fusca TaxID=39272 RepID=A0A8J2L6R0_9HEXA|nr:unnamed protein product [Allacma fusca]
MALKHGTSIVPVLSFGENESYDQVTIKPGGILHQIRQVIRALFGLYFFIPCGKGFLGLEHGILPNAIAITTVVGAPLKVDKQETTTIEDVDKLHLEYINALRRLFEANKSHYGYGNRELTFL